MAHTDSISFPSLGSNNSLLRFGYAPSPANQVSNSHRFHLSEVSPMFLDEINTLRPVSAAPVLCGLGAKIVDFAARIVVIIRMTSRCFPVLPAA
jgi:hypothetical protein